MERRLIIVIAALAFGVLMFGLWMMSRRGPAETPGAPDAEDGSVQFK